MISNKTAEQLRVISLAGGGLEIDGSRYTAEQVRVIALAGKNKQSKLTVCNSGGITAEQMRVIALANPGCVVFK